MADALQQVELRSVSGAVELTVKVVPGASRTRIAGVWSNALKIAVAAPPEGGKANAAVIELLATTFGLRRSDVTLVGGPTNPVKRFRLGGISTSAARERLAARSGA